ncbi:MAG: hypothetical protein ACXWKY_18600 [Caulobacteraceae bacterium]
MSALIRAAPALALLALAVCAYKAPPQKEAAASSAPASSAPAAPAQPAHHYAFQNGDQYGYMSSAHVEVGQEGEAQKPVIVRYLGVQDGVYAIAEVQDGAVVVAQCAKPCQQVRLRGKDLDQTLDLNPNSIVYAALTDAINGQLEVYKSRSR